MQHLVRMLCRFFQALNADLAVLDSWDFSCAVHIQPSRRPQKLDHSPNHEPNVIPTMSPTISWGIQGPNLQATGIASKRLVHLP